MKKSKTETVDIAIVGAGYVGLTTALAIARAAPDLEVAVFDASPKDVWRNDERSSAIAAAAARMLEEMGIWSSLAGQAQPITEMIITDSRTDDPVRPVFLTFGGTAGLDEPFAHMVPNPALIAGLREGCARSGITIFQGAAIDRFEREGRTVRLVPTDTGASIEAKVLIAADGVRSRLRRMAGIKTLQWEYGQSGIVTTVGHERDHGGRAQEHFLPSGPFATLPLTGNRSSLVWTEKTRDAERLLAADDSVFLAELEKRFGHHLGRLSLEGGRRAYPLGLTLARDFVAPRFALVGDAAHGIHPIAGQGLNLGFKDAAALAETIVEAHRLGLDPGAVDVLRRYERWRRFDTVQMAFVTDGLTRLFSNDLAPLRALRDIGLGLVNRAPALKAAFIRQAAGLDPESPRLLQGLAI